MNAERDSVAAGPFVQRLFSTFPGGLPGAGLVFLRAAVAIPLIHGVLTGFSPARAILELMAAGAALLLLIGLWTPLAGAVIAVAELSLAVAHPADPWRFVHLGVMGAALAMLGPGGYSLDAHFFGRKRIQIPQR